MENSGQPISSMAMLVQAVRERMPEEYREYLGLCPDPTNQLRRFPDSDPLGDLNALPLDMLKIVHFKQMRDGDAWPTVDDGDLDCREMRDILNGMGYAGPAIMEIPRTSDVFSNLESSYAYLRSLGTRHQGRTWNSPIPDGTTGKGELPDMQNPATQDIFGNPPGDTRWDALIEWARLFYQWDRFQEAERDYKMEISHTLGQCSGYAARRISQLGCRAQGAPLPWLPHGQLAGVFSVQELAGQGQAAGRNRVLRLFWESSGRLTPEERIREFEERIAVGPAGQLAAAFLLADDPASNPPYRAEYLNRAYQLVGRERDEVGDSGGRRYRRMLNFLDEFMRRSEARNLQIRDRLDAQALLWCVILYGTDRPPANEWPDSLKLSYDAYLHGDTVQPPPPPSERQPEPEQQVAPESDAPSAVDPWSREGLAELAGELLWDEDELVEVITDLQEKRQVIFYGPPGTGKTYVARRIAGHCQQNGGDFAVVQFHPSYSYEDFVEGFRPRIHEGTTRLRAGSRPFAPYRGTGGGESGIHLHPGHRRAEPRQRFQGVW